MNIWERNLIHNVWDNPLRYNIQGSKPYITVSAKGIANGLSTIENDGADFGPDTPGTQTSGIQEAGDYVNQNGGGIVKLREGLFLLNTNINGSNWNGVSIEGSGSNISVESVSPVFSQGTIISYSNNYNGIGVSVILPGVGNLTYYPLIYVVGTGATPNPNGSNLQFKNFLLSGINSPNGTAYPNGMGMYLLGVWNLVVDHVDTQQMWWGKYFNLNGPAGGSNWYLNSTDAIPYDIGTYWVADEGGMVNCTVQGFSYGGHVNAKNSNFTAYSFYIQGINSSTPSQATNIAYGYSTFIISSNSNVSNVMRENGNGPPAVILSGSNISFNNFILNNNTSQPVFTNIDPSGPNKLTNATISNGVVIPSNSSSVKTPLANFKWGSSASQVAGNEVVFDNIILAGSGFYWANPIITQSIDPGYVSPLVLKNIHGATGGFYSYLSVSTPAVPSSGTAVTNSNPFPVKVYINAGAITQIQITINGTAYTVYSNSTASAVYESFTLPVGASITLTYSTAPTWTWVPE
jgi:hypothetical protein